MHGCSLSGRRSSHLYDAGTEHVEFSLTRLTLRAASAKIRDTFGKSHVGGHLLCGTDS